MEGSNPDFYHSPISFEEVQFESTKAYKFKLTSPVYMTLWLPKSIIRHFDAEAGTAMAHTEILGKSILDAEAYYKARYGDLAGELPKTVAMTEVIGKRCKSYNCSNRAAKGHRHCAECHQRRRAKREATAMQPKCSCGSCLSLERSSSGVTKCPTCEKRSRITEVEEE